MTNPPSGGSGLTILGKMFSVILVLGLVGLGAWIILKKNATTSPVDATQTAQTGGNGVGAAGNNNNNDTAAKPFDMSELAPTQTEVPHLVPAIAYVPQNNIVDIELSEYAGYAGLIVANGGLEPNDNSIFATKYGFKVRIRLSEEESWNALNAGKMAASATTADVLAVYGRQFQVVVPAQISYSRGADGLVVRNDIKRVNDLKGKTVVVAQFTESDFFMRYLANEAGIPIKMQADLNAAPDPDSINLVFTSKGDDAGTLFVKALNANSPSLAGCMTWAPQTTDIPAESNGKARLLVSNKNLLIIADILIVNKGFADKNPDKVAALVDGLLTGNRAVRENPEANAELIARAFKAYKWDRNKALAELQKVNLSNLPENLAFFGGSITQGGSFANIYQSAVLAYGTQLVPNPVDSDHFADGAALQKAQASGTYKDQVAAITPIAAAARTAVENDPVLSKNITFFFKENSAELDMSQKQNLDNLSAIKRIMDVSPGSHIMIVGHVDDSNIPTLRKQGGEQLVQSMALVAMQLSKDRANEVKKWTVDHEKADASRLETTGFGWTQPISKTDGSLNRRVEVQWFTLE